MSGDILRLLTYVSILCIIGGLSAALFFSAPTVTEVNKPPQAIIISLCGESKGVFVTSYPISWVDQFTEQTPEFTALTLIAREAGDVYNFEAGSDADCKQLGFAE